jgi:predicted HTH transcriptional regulator
MPMDVKELDKLIRIGEGNTLEFKTSPSHIAREIWSPGGLVSGLKLKDLGHVSRPRNLLLFSLMARMDLVENIGSGIKRIRDVIAAYGLRPPLIQAEGDWFSITFMRKGALEAIEKARRNGKDVTPPEMNGTE